jgi:hypothetical protein
MHKVSIKTGKGSHLTMSFHLQYLHAASIELCWAGMKPVSLLPVNSNAATYDWNHGMVPILSTLLGEKKIALPMKAH